ncbi:hypothetical protein TGMAS_320015 [Toxoplasma gondii MAS]|uniref:Uncharacterized protein n=1 Tax=Toxoplasma gondii MAS TaxID=943118 RepID=A0A086QFB0_TOXGO|nr:hypothetical protein TGMAS_320015 [Toxoplasma gondii MAS]
MSVCQGFVLARGLHAHCRGAVRSVGLARSRCRSSLLRTSSVSRRLDASAESDSVASVAAPEVRNSCSEGCSQAVAFQAPFAAQRNRALDRHTCISITSAGACKRVSSAAVHPCSLWSCDLRPSVFTPSGNLRQAYSSCRRTACNAGPVSKISDARQRTERENADQDKPTNTESRDSVLCASSPTSAEMKPIRDQTGGRLSSLLMLGLAGFGLGWIAQTNWEDAQNGFYPETVMRVRCLQLPGNFSETHSEEAAKNAFEEWTAFASRQKGFLSSRLYVQPGARTEDSERFGGTKFLVLDRWGTAADQRAAAEAFATPQDPKQCEAKDANSAAKTTRHSAEQREAQEQSVEEAARAPFCDKDSGQVYVFDSRKTAPLWRVFTHTQSPNATP